MQLRLQPALDRTAETSQEALRLVAAFMTPAAVLAGVLGAWRLTSDVGWTDEFFISKGLLSHWQVWFALAGALQTGAVIARKQIAHRAHAAAQESAGSQ